jgi:hypothetical protein
MQPEKRIYHRWHETLLINNLTDKEVLKMKKIPQDMIAGTIHNTRSSGKAEIVLYTGCMSVSVRFIESGLIKSFTSGNIRVGKIKDPMLRTTHGVGFLGVGRFSAFVDGNQTAAYLCWSNMIMRCYDKSFQRTHPTYIGCTVDDCWHNFQSFAEWHSANSIDGYHLDKDIKVAGNKIYSPETCKFVSPKENISASVAKKYEFTSPDGVAVTVFNVSKFSLRNDLNPSAMCAVSNGKRKSHKGWSL